MIPFDIKKEGECNGLLFRVRENVYYSKNGCIVKDRRYVPLKRKSCKCGKCISMLDDIRDGVEVIDGGEEGDIVRLVMVNMSTDWETGYLDNWDYEMVVTKDG